jgi:hypothetical protein
MGALTLRNLDVGGHLKKCHFKIKIPTPAKFEYWLTPEKYDPKIKI